MEDREPTSGPEGNRAVSPAEAATWYRKALRLEYATIGWNSTEAVITLVLGFMARSLALIAFGLDSIIELFASAVVVWHMRSPARADHADRTRLALRLVSGAFFGLSLFLAIAAIQSLITAARPEESPVGIVYLALTAVVMFTLARLKATVARQLDAGPLAAEAHVSMLDAFLASAVLLALVANAAVGWWWADSGAALVVAGFALAGGLGTLERDLGEGTRPRTARRLPRRGTS